MAGMALLEVLLPPACAGCGRYGAGHLRWVPG